VRAVTDETFEVEVLRSPKPVVVDFWAPWCSPCAAVGRVLEELEAEHPGVGFVTMNIDEHPQTAFDHGVLSLPTVILFADGEVRATAIGARSRGYFEKAFADVL
jgi:thioredoxin 1